MRMTISHAALQSCVLTSQSCCGNGESLCGRVLAQRLQTHISRIREGDSPYARVVASFADKQLARSFDAHLTSRHRHGVGTGVGPAARRRFLEMQRAMLAWESGPLTVASLRQAHAILLPGGGELRTTPVRVSSTRFVTALRMVWAPRSTRGCALHFYIFFTFFFTVNLQ